MFFENFFLRNFNFLEMHLQKSLELSNQEQLHRMEIIEDICRLNKYLEETGSKTDKLVNIDYRGCSFSDILF